jgi:nitrate/nitrite transport system permease protein
MPDSGEPIMRSSSVRAIAADVPARDGAVGGRAAAPTAAAAAPVAAAAAVASDRGSIAAAVGRRLAGAMPLAVSLVIVLGLWQLLCSQPGAALPTPAKVVADTWPLIVDPFFDHGGVDKGLFWHLFASLKRVAIGYSLAAVTGIALGVLIGQSTLALRGLDPIFQVLRTVPPLAWLPISLAAFKNTDPSAIFVIFITAIWPIIINTSVGVRNIPPDYRNVARVIGLSPLEYFVKIMLPATVPYIFTGLKIGIGLSWLAIVAAEMLIGGVGIGFFIWDAWNSSLLSEIILALLYVGLVGFCLDRLITLLGRIVSRSATPAA